MKRHFYGGRKVSCVDLFVKGKVRDFLRECVFEFFGAFNNINSARKLITMPVLTITQNQLQTLFLKNT